MREEFLNIILSNSEKIDHFSMIAEFVNDPSRKISHQAKKGLLLSDSQYSKAILKKMRSIGHIDMELVNSKEKCLNLLKTIL